MSDMLAESDRVFDLGCDFVHATTTGSTLLVSLARPSARNAINLEMSEALSRAWDHLDAAPALRVGVLTGSGGVFSAGADLKDLERGRKPLVDGRGFAGFVGRPPRKPLIAAVDGWALGGGFEMVLACDLVVASPTAQFGLPEVKRGLLPAAGGLVRLPRMIPSRIAMELALTGEPIDAKAAARMGVVNRIVEEGDTVRAAIELADVIGGNGPLAVAAAKRILIESHDWDLGTAFDRQQPIVDSVHTSEDAAEGARAFLEKRTPKWSAR